MKHHGKDILRKSQRKNRYLFSFPGLLGPISGGKIGALKDIGTKNPVLYLDFPRTIIWGMILLQMELKPLMKMKMKMKRTSKCKEIITLKLLCLLKVPVQ